VVSITLVSNDIITLCYQGNHQENNSMIDARVMSLPSKEDKFDIDIAVILGEVY